MVRPHAIHFLFFCRRSVAERQKLEVIVSEHQKSLQLSAEEAEQMQTIAEYYLEQGIEKGVEKGIEKGARANAIQNILAVLQTHFPEHNTQSVEQALETTPDLDHLTELLLTAMQAPTFEDFLEVVKG